MGFISLSKKHWSYIEILSRHIYVLNLKLVDLPKILFLVSEKSLRKAKWLKIDFEVHLRFSLDC